MTTHKLAFPRQESGSGFVLSCGILVLEDTSGNGFESSSDALAAMGRGLDQWVAETTKGREAFNNSRAPYKSLGISLEELADQDLESFQPYIEAHGVRVLLIDILGSDDVQDLDMPLVG